jgi:hypothetical protein
MKFQRDHMDRKGMAVQNRSEWLFTLTCVPVIIIILTLGCASGSASRRESRSFREAVEQNTIEAYQEFIANNPDGEHVEEAKKRLVELEWNKAEKTGTADAYSAFIRKYKDYPSDTDYIGLAESSLGKLREKQTVEKSNEDTATEGKGREPETKITRRARRSKDKKVETKSVSGEESGHERLTVRFLTHIRTLKEPEWTGVFSRGWQRILAFFEKLYSFFFNLREVEIDRSRIVRGDG